MAKTLEVFADISCPFTHVGLTLVQRRLEQSSEMVEVHVRAWPLEWVNDTPLAAADVERKVAALEQQLGPGFFDGIEPASWPDTTIPALNLAASAYRRDHQTGFAVSRRLRDRLFRLHHDVANPDVLGDCAAEFGLETPREDATPSVVEDYEEGQRRGVRGSPDFWVKDEEFFCPSLDIDHDDDGKLIASLDLDGLDALFEAVFASPS